MSVLRAGNTTLEDGKVRICVPIAYETENEILEESVRIGKSSVADIAEWRIDWYQDVFQPRKRNALAKKIRKNLQGKPLLVTFRSRREGGERDITPTAYQALLDEIIESNSIESNVVDLLDVELSQGMACVQELIKHAHQMGIGVIVSQHDFKKTPEASNLITTMEQMAGYGADVCKSDASVSCRCGSASFGDRNYEGESSRDTFNYNVNGAHRMCEQALRRLIWQCNEFWKHGKSQCTGTGISQRAVRCVMGN